MTTVPASPRSTTYTLASASAGPFLVGFRIFDPALTVYVNDAPRTDYTLSAVFTDGYTDTASITFGAALPIGARVKIDGAQPIARAEQYLPADPTLVQKMNIELGRLWVQMQQIERDRVRGLRAAPGPEMMVTDFGNITGTDSVVDTATWTAAQQWAKSNRGGTILVGPDTPESCIASLECLSFARILAFGHTFRVNGTIGFTQAVGQQLIDFEMYGATVVPHVPLYVTARAFDMRVHQRCTVHVKLDGFPGGKAWRTQTEALTVRDYVDESLLLGSNNCIYNEVKIYARSIQDGFDLNGHYGTTPTVSPPNSSPVPTGVVTKNDWYIYGWNVTGTLVHARKCVDGDFILADGQLSANGARIFVTGNGSVDTFTGNNYANRNKVRITAAVAAGVTSATLVYCDSWTMGYFFEVYHDIDFTTVTLTEVGLNGALTAADFDHVWEGSGADSVTGNTATFWRGSNVFIQGGDGVQQRPGLSFNSERGMGFWRESAGRLSLSHAGARTFYWEAGVFAIPAGSASLPSLAFTGATTTGIYRSGTSLGVATSGVARAVFSDTFVNVTAPLYINSVAAITTTGRIYDRQGAPTTKAAAATLTAAEVESGVLEYSGAAANITLPTGTAFDTGFPLLATDRAVMLSVVNTGSGTATITGNTGLTLTGNMAVAVGESGLFRIRRTGTNTYTVHRIS